MSVYMLVEAKIRNADLHAKYLDKIAPMVQEHGGRYLVRGGPVTPLAGGWKPDRIMLLEFPSFTAIREWLFSGEYKALGPLRESAAETRAVVLEACDGKDSAA